jgi:dihydroorotase-like cyclic amidohydrolase
MTKLIKLPGLIDGHVHLREPGASQKEDFRTGTEAALAGGITTVIDMPNNPKPTTTLQRLNKKIKLAEKKALCQVFFFFGADNNNFGQFVKVKDKARGLKVYLDHTTGPLLIESLEVLMKIFQFWPSSLPILVHAEDATMLKVLGMVSMWNKPVHFCHISQACEIEMIKKAKKKGLPITCEVTPHHLFLTEENLKHLSVFGLMRPPLRSRKDVEALWKNLAFIDCFATDHAPHTKKEKKSKNPPHGVPGLETALPLLLTAVNEGRLTINDIILRYFKNPAKIFKIKQDNNTYIEVDLDRKWEIKNENLLTKCGWSPFAGWKVQGKVLRVFVNGKKVFEDKA